MVEEDLGEATIVYEHPEEGTVEKTVENEHVAYFQDHWIVKTDESEAGDTVRRIPAGRVYYVERDVESFEEEIATALDEVSSVLGDFEEGIRGLRRQVTEALPTGGGERRETEPYRIEIETEESESERS